MTYAFFDVDGTLISIKSMFSFRRFSVGKLGIYRGVIGRLRFLHDELEYKIMLAFGVKREVLNRKYYEKYRGVNYQELINVIELWWQEESRSASLFLENTLDVLDRHRKSGNKTVMVSGSFLELLQPLKKYLSIDYCLATKLDVVNGKLSGYIQPPVMIGEGKVKAITDFALANKINLSQCYAYGDHSSDIPMLKLVGHPTVVSKDNDLIEYASLNDWSVLTLNK